MIVVKVVNTLVSIVQLLLVFYIFLELFNANQVTFVRWIYGLAEPLMRPFAGVFDPYVINGQYTLDLSAVFAFMVYSAFGYLLTMIITAIIKR